MGKQCAAIKGDGTRCGGNAPASSDFCFMHDPERAEVAAAARTKAGGRKRGQHLGRRAVNAPTTIAELVQVTGRAIKGVLTGQLDHHRAGAAASLIKMQASLLKAQPGQPAGAEAKDFSGIPTEQLEAELRDELTRLEGAN